MNEDLRKRNKRNNLIILVVGIVIIIGIIAGFSIHNHRVATQTAAEKFARTHFNPNVKIDESMLYSVKQKAKSEGERRVLEFKDKLANMEMPKHSSMRSRSRGLRI